MIDGGISVLTNYYRYSITTDNGLDYFLEDFSLKPEPINNRQFIFILSHQVLFSLVYQFFCEGYDSTFSNKSPY
jgi:hypothetical protein